MPSGKVIGELGFVGAGAGTGAGARTRLNQRAGGGSVAERAGLSRSQNSLCREAPKTADGVDENDHPTSGAEAGSRTVIRSPLGLRFAAVIDP